MSAKPRWDRCVSHHGAETSQFITDYFGESNRNVVIIAGVGIDPRSPAVSGQLADTLRGRLRGLFICERRPNAAPKEVARVEQNAAEMASRVPASELDVIDIFATDGAVVGGRMAIRALAERCRMLDWETDVVVDMSALSIGVAFPVVRYLLEAVVRNKPHLNLHLVLADEPEIDRRIASVACDRVETVHGFRGDFGVSHTGRRAKLWLPQLVRGQKAVLDRIHKYVDPDDVCPILPFPASSPREADGLIEHFRHGFESAWGVDSRDIVFADERNPLDLYRSILRIDDRRRGVFGGVGGSLLVLSPQGNKVLEIGALMAAVERDLPVVYVETSAYAVDFDGLDWPHQGRNDVLHVWLHGEAYSAPAAAEERGS